MLTANDLVIERGGKTLAGPVSIALQPGDRLAVSGSNGSGKSTLLRQLAGLLHSKTPVLLGGKPVAKNRDQIGYCDQLDPLYSDWNAKQHLQWWFGIHDCQSSIFHQIEQFQLTPFLDKRTRFLSGGQRRRLTLALACRPNAKIWILDEPFAHLDAQGVEACKTAIQNFSGAVVIADPVQFEIATKRLELDS